MKIKFLPLPEEQKRHLKSIAASGGHCPDSAHNKNCETCLVRKLLLSDACFVGEAWQISVRLLKMYEN